MKKNGSAEIFPKGSRSIGKTDPVTIGMDLGDRISRCCVLNASGEVVKEATVATTKKGMAQVFGLCGEAGSR